MTTLLPKHPRLAYQCATQSPSSHGAGLPHLFSSVLGQQHTNRLVGGFVALFFCLSLPQSAQAQSYQMYSSGTGFFISLQGHVVTNAHVVAECTDDIVLRMPNAEWKLNKVAMDPARDLALLQSHQAHGYSPLHLRSGTLQLTGEVKAAVLGYPGQQIDTAVGEPKVVATQLYLPATPYPNQSQNMLFEHVVAHGNSGGPLIDSGGNVLGVVMATGSLQRVHATSQTVAETKQVDIAIRAETLAEYVEQYGVRPQVRDSESNYPIDYLGRHIGSSVGNVVCARK